MGKIIDGKALAKELREGFKTEVEKYKKEGRVPGLTVVLVGDDPASQVYVRYKEKACQEIGINSQIIRKDNNTTQEELLAIIDELNRDNSVDGILVQLPLPEHIDEKQIIEAIDPMKDVDGFHPVNTGRLFSGQRDSLMFEACTPLGIIKLLQKTGVEIEGKKAVVVGRSNIVGKPIAHLLLARHATVTICHSRTADLGAETRQADILIAAAGRPELIKGDMVKEGAIVIDVGTNRVDGKLIGDVAFEEVSKKASYITPVPGGVGPMTITMLLYNTLKARKHHGV